MTFMGSVVDMLSLSLQQLHQQQGQTLAAEIVSARTECAGILQESLLSLKSTMRHKGSCNERKPTF